MRKDGRQSSNVEDRRGRAMKAGGAGLGLGGIVLIVAFLLLGGDPQTVVQVLDASGNGSGGAPAPGGQPPADDAQARFIAVVLGSTEDVWSADFAQRGERYPEPTLVLFEDRVASACGTQSSAIGPFYCPGDRQIYLDLSFFRQLDALGGKGDFAQAYVVAHEVGHHLQTVGGIDREVAAMKRGRSEAEQNALSVRQELQADCFAGVWAHSAAKSGVLEPGDLEEGLAAAAAIGDDALQKRAQGYTVPETWTHGSSEQRASWFRKGLQAGTMDACDTLAGLR